MKYTICLVLLLAGAAWADDVKVEDGAGAILPVDAVELVVVDRDGLPILGDDRKLEAIAIKALDDTVELTVKGETGSLKLGDKSDAGAMVGGNTYAASVWIKLNEKAAPKFVSFQVLDSDGEKIGWQDVTTDTLIPIDSDGWFQMACVAKPKPGKNHAYVVIEAEGDGAKLEFNRLSVLDLGESKPPERVTRFDKK